MKIGLIDVDSHNFPNLALMKLSAHHKRNGDDVSWYDPLFGGHYDRVYMSKVFSFTPDYEYCINADEIVKGGTGYCITNENGIEVYHKENDAVLPKEVEHKRPDYSLYKIKGEAYGYLTRGCPRGCDFCHVGTKEGRCSVKVADLKEFWHGQKIIKLLDPNMYACREWESLAEQLIRSKAYVDFTQGIDARIMDDARIESLKAMKLKMLHCAWDRYEDKDLVLPKIEKIKKELGLDRRKFECFVLCNYNSTFEQDIDRVMELRKIGVDPYVMIYDKANLTPGHKLKKLARWVNAKWIWAVCPTFEEYLKVRGSNA